MPGSSSQINGPPGQTFNMEAAFLKISGEMGQMTTLLGRICEHLPITDARESNGPPPRLNVTEPGEAAAPNDELLTELSAVLTDEEKKVSKLTQQLADIVNKRWDNKLAPDKMNKILEKYAQPENCSAVTVTRVNPEIWARADAGQRKADLRLANMQQSLQKATFAKVLTTNKLVVIRNDPNSAPPHLNEMITNNIDAIALLGHVGHELSHFWREKLKPALKPEYHALCSSETNIASTKYLFGDDLAKQIRHANETNRIWKAVGSSKNSRPFRRDPFWQHKPSNYAYRSGPGSANRQPFLGTGHQSNVRKKYNNGPKKGQKK